LSTTREELVVMFRVAWGDSLASPATGELASEVAGPASLTGASAHAAAISRELSRWLWSRNQFALLDDAARGELADGVARALAQMEQTNQVGPALRQHRRELAAFVRAHFGDAPRDVVCAEYDPALQLALLGLYADELAEPVLDIGCGARAALVQLLREQHGVEAHGIDRAIEQDVAPEVASTADWLSFAYPRGKYGSVLSHHGFTLHFLHHHLAAGDTAFDYARTYMTILRSLAPGGRFAYTPGLPFLESMLDASLYRVHRVPFAEALRVASLRKIEASTGLSLSHATHVERLR
jgi:hypothetical protein